jgi:hypothetical protein
VTKGDQSVRRVSIDACASRDDIRHADRLHVGLDVADAEARHH